MALPITIGSIVVPLVNMVDSTLILPRLQAGGFSEEQALAMYGNFSGAAMPLVNVPTIFTMALATSLVPAIADAHAHENAGQIRTLSSLAIRIGLMLGLPAALGLYQLARPVSILLYNNAEVARSLQVAAFAIIFISLKQTTAPVLQGLGKTYLPVSHMFAGLIVKVVLNYFLTAVPAINIIGPAIGTIVAFAIASLLNLLHLQTCRRQAFRFRTCSNRPYALQPWASSFICVPCWQAPFRFDQQPALPGGGARPADGGSGGCLLRTGYPGHRSHIGLS